MMSEPKRAPDSRRRPRTRHGLQERVAAAILEAAARAIALRGGQASMAEIAAEAGVARATLYRYFPSRAALLDELARVAAATAGERLVSARVDEVQAREGVRRAVRALVEVGDALVAVVPERRRAESLDELVRGPLHRLVERAQASGQLRDDVPAAWLTDSLLALTVALLSARPALGREDAVAAIASLYLDGAHTRPRALSPQVNPTEESSEWTSQAR